MSAVWNIVILIAFIGAMIRWALPRASTPELWASMDQRERTLSWLMLWALFAVPTVLAYLILRSAVELIETVLS